MSWLLATPGWLFSRRRLGLVFVLAGIGGLIRFGGPLPFWLQGALWIGLLGGLGRFLRPVARKVFGPVFFYELVRTTRTGRYSQLRALYAGILLVGLALLYASWFGSQEFFESPVAPLTDMPRFAASFFRTFFLIQYLAVLLAAPVFVAGAIAEDRERGTLDLLFTTHLSDSEIVLGKLAARLAHLALLLLTGLPILGLTQFLGGIDPNWVIASFIATFATMLSMGSLALVASIRAKRSVDALVNSYRWALGFMTMGACIPVVNLGNPLVVIFLVMFGIDSLLSESAYWMVWAFVYAAVHLFIAAALCGGAFRDLTALRQAGPAVRVLNLIETPERGKQAAPKPRPPIADRPMLWKEMYTGRAGRTVELGIFNSVGGFLVLLLAGGLFLFLALFELVSTRNSHESLNQLALLITVPVTCVMLLQAGVLAAGSVSREIESNTLDGLLTTTLERQEILKAKLLGSLWGARPWAYMLCATWYLALLGGGLPFVAAVLLPAALLVHVTFAACLGLFWSLAAGSTMRAMLWTVLSLAALAIGPLILLPKEFLGTFSPPANLAVLGHVTPRMVTNYLFPRWEEEQTCALLGVLLYALMAAGLWMRALVRLQTK